MSIDSLYGTLYGISVGPGDPELLTLKGLRLLQQAPVVAFPAGVRGQAGMAQQIVSQWLQPHQTQIALPFPYVQDTETLMAAWRSAAMQVWQYLSQGQNVVFACEGEVSFYSTFTYLAQALHQLQPHVRIETVPGVCSPFAAVAALGIPLTVQQQRLVVLPALYCVTELDSVLEWADVIVLLKVSSVYAQVWELLQQHRLLERSHVVEWASSPQQVIHSDLTTKATLELPYFSLLIVQATPSNLSRCFTG